MYFADRADAGRKLAARLQHYKGKNAIVLAIPRGGVVVGAEVARELHADLEVSVPRKIGAPYNPELAIGAVAEDGSLYLDPHLVEQVGASEAYVKGEVGRQLREVARRLSVYRPGARELGLRGRIVIVVDDGVATGATVKALLQFLRRRGPERVVVAVPVGPPDTVEALRRLADEVVCLHQPEFFLAISNFYRDFEQVEDEEVVRILTEFRARGRQPKAN